MRPQRNARDTMGAGRATLELQAEIPEELIGRHIVATKGLDEGFTIISGAYQPLGLLGLGLPLPLLAQLEVQSKIRYRKHLLHMPCHRGGKATALVEGIV